MSVYASVCVVPSILSQDFVLRLVQSSDEVVAEQMARLLNTLSSLKLGQRRGG